MRADKSTSISPALAASKPFASLDLSHLHGLPGALLLALLVFAVFINGIKAPYIFDDKDSIPNNVSIRSYETALNPPMANGITVSGRPILNLSFAINYACDKAQSEGVHLGNILIHALAALTLWGVVRRTLLLPILAGRFERDADWQAWLTAALWAVHPLQTESVTYMVQRAESLVGLFYLLTLYCFIRYTANPRWIWFAAAFSACLLGMGSKEVMATAPFVIFLYDRTFISGSFRMSWKRHGRLHLCHASTLLMLGYLVLASKGRGGSVGADEVITHWSYLLTQTYAIVHYIQLGLWPAGLTLDYGALVIRDLPTIITCGLVVIFTLAATTWALVRKPTLGFLGAWFFAILAPSSSFIPVNTQTIAEHRIYLSLAAIVLGGALLAHSFLKRCFWIALAALILGAAGATFFRNKLYTDEIALWKDVVSKRPDNPRAWVALASNHLYKTKIPAQVLEDCEQALKLRPNYPEALILKASALVKLGKQQEGVAMAAKSLSYDPDNPNLNAGAGGVYMDAGLYETALTCFVKALKPNPTNSSLNYNLANCLMALGRDDDAEQHFKTAIESRPTDIDVLNNLGALVRRNGRVDEAIAWFQRALELAPNSHQTHNNIGIAYMMQGKTEDALRHLREAVRIEPQSYEARINLCRTLAQAGQTDEAITLCESLLKEKPDAQLYNNLGALYGQKGQLENSETAFHAALQIDPNNADARKNYEKLRAYLDPNGDHQPTSPASLNAR